MWPLLIGSTVLSVLAFLVIGSHKYVKPDDETDDDSDEPDDTDDDDSPSPAPTAPEVDETDDTYDDADVYYDVDAGKRAARKARVPKIRE